MRQTAFIFSILALFLSGNTIGQSNAPQAWAGAYAEIAETSGLTGWAYGLAGGAEWKRFFLGGFVMQSSPLLRSKEPGNSYEISARLGGLTGGYHRPVIGLLEITGGLRIGTGSTSLKREGSDTPVNDAVYIAVPFAGMEMPIGNSARISLYSGFRLFGGFEPVDNWRNRDLFALANTLSVRVLFGKK